MRLTVALTVVVVAVLAGSATGQLALGPQGLAAPPINVLALYRFLRRVFNHMIPSTSPLAEKKEGKQVEGTFDVEDVGRNCVAGESCWHWLTDDDDDDDDDEGEDNGEGDEDGEEEEEEMLDPIEAKIVVTKWIMAYVAIIIATSVITLVIGYPYLITGQTFRSLDTELLPFLDHQDSMLLLTWLLGEASGDESCLERVVCLSPERSARYLSVPKVLTTFFSRWVPVHYQDQVERLTDITENGLHHSCEQYICSVLPNL